MTESFPRGGKKLKVKTSLDLLDRRHDQKKKHKTQIKKGNKKDKRTEETFLPNAAHYLRKRDIQEGMTILGRVSSVKRDNMIVCLPGGSLGIVTLFDISRLYSETIKRASTEVTNRLQIKPISSLYNPGDYVVCYIKKNCGDKKISVSLEPQLIHQGVPRGFLKKGVKLACSIMTVQEDGYTIDSGVVNVIGFLNNHNVDDGKRYSAGNQLFCVVTEATHRNETCLVQLSAKKKIVDKVSVMYDTVFLDSITPGTKMTLRIVKRVKNGFQVKFGENNIGYVHDLYLDKDINEYDDGMEVTGILLYVLPVVKLAYFSLLINEHKKTFNYGDIIPKAKVLQIRQKEGILIRLSSEDKTSVKHRARGLVPRNKTDVPLDKISTTFAPGTAHKCRIISYRWMEQLYLCSMESQLLRAKLISDLKIGDVVKVLITGVNKKKCVLVRKGRVRGFVPPEHVSDNGFQSLALIDKSVQARVLSIDPETSLVIFTLKDSLIHSDLPVLHDISEAKRGSTYHGTVMSIRNNSSGKFYIIRFYGNVRGVLRDTQKLEIDTFDHFNYRTVGQTVAVRVKSVDVQKNKLKLELAPEQLEVVESCFSVGEEVEGVITKLVRDKTNGLPNGLVVVQICKDGRAYKTGFLPAGHVAPCVTLGYELISNYKLGETIRAVVFATKPHVLLTRSFIPQREEMSFNSLKVGSSILCSIHDKPQNVKVVLPVEDYKTYGVVLRRNTSNFDLLRQFQLLYAKIEGINKREKRLHLTLNFPDIWENTLNNDMKINASVEVLMMYVEKTKELTRLIENQTLAEITLGQKVSGIVVNVDREYIEIRVNDEVVAFAQKEHIDSNYVIGQSVNGVVLWKSNCLDVSLLPKIVNSISSKQDLLPALPLGVTLRAKILMKTEWYVLVLVKRNNLGYLACLPARRHLNDISPDLKQYEIFAKVRVYCLTSRDESAFLPICMLKSEFENLQTSGKTASKPSCSAKTKPSKRKKLSDEDDVFRVHQRRKKLKSDNLEEERR